MDSFATGIWIALTVMMSTLILIHGDLKRINNNLSVIAKHYEVGHEPE